MKKTPFPAICCILAAAFAAKPAAADSFKFNPHDWQLRLRGIDLAPQESSTTTNGGKISVGNRIAPELDISYFFNDRISAELILATTKHNMAEKSPNIDLGSVWALPPTLTVQYHFLNATPLVPYLGAGLNYTIFYNVDKGAATSIKYDDHIGYALQAGADYKLDEHWMLNADIKKIFLKTKASVNGGAVRANVDLDPWVFGLGVGYRF
ncbi:MAG: outer membrane beta-barrel protein [Alphaproteobacteria bacterium]|nr:outer membrane beta-barrel protein [Alphaproteobacteria bacterium]